MIVQLLIAWLAVRISRPQDHVMTYLREENRILKAKLKGKWIQLTDLDVSGFFEARLSEEGTRCAP